MTNVEVVPAAAAAVAAPSAPAPEMTGAETMRAEMAAAEQAIREPVATPAPAPSPGQPATPAPSPVSPVAAGSPAAPAGAAAPAAEAAPAGSKRAWKAARAGADGKMAELEKLDGLSADDVAKGDVKIQFTSSKQQRQMTIDQLVERAQLFDGLTASQERLRGERNEAAAKLAELTPQVERAARLENAVAKAFEASRTDGGASLTRLKDEYLKALEKGGGEAQPAAAAADQPPPPEEVSRYNAGAKLVETHMLPYGQQLGATYDADPVEIVREIVRMCGEEPLGTLTPEKVDEIIHQRLPLALEEAGYVAKGERPRFDMGVFSKGAPAPEQVGGFTSREKRAAASAAATGEAALRVENERLKAELAASKPAPPALGGARGAASGRAVKPADQKAKSDLIDVSAAESMDDIRKALRGA